VATARVGANLGFEMSFAIDATHTFDLGDHDGGTIAADDSLGSRRRTSIRNSAGS
jgi:nicotinamidase-related amidase